jgi:hypothetical protein
MTDKTMPRKLPVSPDNDRGIIPASLWRTPYAHARHVGVPHFFDKPAEDFFKLGDLARMTGKPGSLQSMGKSPSTPARKAGKPAKKRRRIIVVRDRMQKAYRYERVAPEGRDFDPGFQPELTPKEMLALGVFGGKYMTDGAGEFPASWFRKAKLSPQGPDDSLNYFGVNASQPLRVWRQKGWIHPDDPRGWFQWYCRYYMGRRMPEEDARQIKRWKAFRRHLAQLRKNCEKGDFGCRKRQRQALLQWAYDSRKV